MPKLVVGKLGFSYIDTAQHWSKLKEYVAKASVGGPSGKPMKRLIVTAEYVFGHFMPDLK
ncbi:hypothetical protein PENSUB_4612 [Penicillium subrubescens]|uniref:Uncharacterized protein n=1 Tax=Penicillium subrubescens TaxID=1316194 RepID=A0A1Q5UC09_9EURO|nr:hypothetical protein PENSUB_4612 [Penicillium subrubescens]